MKNHLLFCVALAVCAQLQAQTNTFPGSGNVGIGTASPSWPLEINAYGARIINGNGNAAQFDLVQTTGGHDWSLASWGSAAGGGTLSNKFSIYDSTAGAHRLTIDASGNVGIGTTAPLGKLQISNVGGGAYTRMSDIVIQRSDALNTTGKLSFVGTGGTTGDRWEMVSDADIGNDFGFSYDGSKFLQILTNGNVGIGNSSPISKLQIGGGGAAGTLPTNTQLYIPGIQQSGGSIANSIAMGVDTNANATMAITTRSTSGNIYPLFMDIRSQNTPIATFSTGGNVGIGTTSPNPAYKLDVAGAIHAHEVVVDTSGADYVFATNYKLMPLPEVERAIQRDKHLPGIPSAQQMSSGGMSVGEMQAKLLAKVEELTLHQIEQEKLLAAQQAEIATLKTEVSQLKQP